MLILARMNATHEVLSKLQSVSIATRRSYGKDLIKDDFYMQIMSSIRYAEEIARQHLLLLEQDHERYNGKFYTPSRAINRFETKL